MWTFLSLDTLEQKNIRICGINDVEGEQRSLAARAKRLSWWSRNQPFESFPVHHLPGESIFLDPDAGCRDDATECLT